MKKLSIILLGLVPLTSYAGSNCTSREVIETYRYSSTIAVMYGQHGIPNSRDDKDLALLRAERKAKSTCETIQRLQNCKLKESAIIENVWMTSGIPYVVASATYTGCI